MRRAPRTVAGAPAATGLRRRWAPLAVIGAVALLGACGSGGTHPAPATSAPATPTTTGGVAPGPAIVPPAATAAEQSRATQVLVLTARDGYDATAPIVAKHATTVRGGLYVNWIGTWNGTTDPAANTNLNSEGKTDAEVGNPERHDPLTDLVMLRNFEDWSALHPGDHRFSAIESALTPIVAAEFTGYRTYRCWIYGELIDLDDFDPSPQWTSLAETFIAGIAEHNIVASTGEIIDPVHHDYRTDWAADCAGALTDAGTRFHRPAWVADGERAADYLVAHAVNPTTGLFPGQISHPTDGPETVQDPQVKLGSAAQLLDGLLTVYDTSHDRTLLDAVVRAVNALWSPAIGVHDATDGGFYFAVDADGSNVSSDYKESRQGWLVPLLQHLEADGVDESTRLAEMRHVVTDLLWQAGMDGYPYQVSPDFMPYVTHGVTEDWVTSEAMGIAADALLGLSSKDFENS